MKTEPECTLIIYLFNLNIVFSQQFVTMCTFVTATFVFSMSNLPTDDSLQSACVAVAVLIQFFFLVVFFMMLLIGIEILICVIHVFFTKFHVKVFAPLAWSKFDMTIQYKY